MRDNRHRNTPIQRRVITSQNYSIFPTSPPPPPKKQPQITPKTSKNKKNRPKTKKNPAKACTVKKNSLTLHRF